MRLHNIPVVDCGGSTRATTATPAHRSLLWDLFLKKEALREKALPYSPCGEHLDELRSPQLVLSEDLNNPLRHEEALSVGALG